MKEKFYQYSPALLGVLGLLLWIMVFYFYKLMYISKGTVWVLFLLEPVIVNFSCGLLIRKLYLQSTVDGLTAVMNRRGFLLKMGDMSGMRFPVSLMMIDIDDFKRINDTYGHIAGDHVLALVSKTLKREVHDFGIVARWGGEEFVILLPGASKENVYQLSQDIIKAVRELNFIIETIVETITVSIGVATVAGPVDADIIVKFADEALYKAKETKNAFIHYDQISKKDIV